MRRCKIEEVKKCSKCGKTKPVTEFFQKGKKKDGTVKYLAYCKECQCNYGKEKYYEKKAFIESRKTLCAKCGESRKWMLDFHHIDPNEKEYTVSEIKRASLDVIGNEIDKCVVLCANCHRDFHYQNSEFNTSLKSYLQFPSLAYQ